MSVGTYSELVTALDGATGYLHRVDLTSLIPDFIKICESTMNRRLKLLLQELETTLTATVSSRQMAVPTRFGTPIDLWQTTYLPRTKLEFLMAEHLPVGNSNAPSDYWTVDGDYIKTENPADIAYTYMMRYWGSFDLATTTTNTVLSNYPDIYIYGALSASVPYTQDFDKLPVWKGLFDAAIKEAISDTVATKGKQTLRTEFAHPRPNIFMG